MAFLSMKRLRSEEGAGEAESVGVAADLLVMLSRRTGGGERPIFPAGRRLFRCKSCGRQFPSFQALGGHRASHKKPRLGVEPHVTTPEKPRAHECPICGVEFAMGQALGGHMRRHRTGAGAFPLVFVEEKKSSGAPAKGGLLSLDLDLNQPPSEKDGDFCSLRLGLGLGHTVMGVLY